MAVQAMCPHATKRVCALQGLDEDVFQRNQGKGQVHGEKGMWIAVYLMGLQAHTNGEVLLKSWLSKSTKEANGDVPPRTLSQKYHGWLFQDNKMKALRGIALFALGPA